MGLEIRELGPEWDTRWDSLVGRTEASGFMQSTAWAAFKRAEGYDTLRYGLFEDEGEDLTGGASLMAYSAQGSEGFFLCPEGPLLPWHASAKAREGLRLLARKVEQQAEQRGGLGLRSEPHLPPPRPSLMRNWTRAPVDLNPVHSLMLDLTLSAEEFRAQMRPKGRYNLGLAHRHGVTLTHSREMRYLSRFYTLFEETAQRQGFFAEPFGFFLNLGAALFPSGQAELFFAERQGETLAAVLVILFGRRATYLYGGSSTRQRNVMAPYALHWEVMQAARERQCVEYDLYGYDPFGLPDHLYAGFSQFKRQFGGRRIDNIGAFDLLFYDRLAASLVERLAQR